MSCPRISLKAFAKALCLCIVSVLCSSSPVQARIPLVEVTDPKSGIRGAHLFPIEENKSDADWYRPLNDPELRPYTKGELIRPDTPVVGLRFNDQNWVFFWKVMKNYHVANLTLGGKPVVMTVCQRCHAAIARDPVVDGRRLTFHLAGLYNGSFLVADYETDTYWTPFTGEALEGPLKGKKLRQIPTVTCRWKEWVDLHPSGMIADERGRWNEGRGATRRAEGAFYRDFPSLVLKPLDRRLRDHDPILGVNIADKACAYPFAALDGAPQSAGNDIALQDTVGGEPIVILHQRDSWAASAYSRRLDGKTLEFTADKEGRFVDSVHHSHWNYDGEAVDGPVAGRKLTEVPYQVEDWYIWAAFHPETTIYGSAGQGTVPAGGTTADKSQP